MIQIGEKRKLSDSVQCANFKPLISFPVSAETGECECRGVLPYVTCLWQRVKHTVTRLTHLLDHREHTQHSNQAMKNISLRSLELEGIQTRNKTNKPNSAPWKTDSKSNNTKVKVQRVDPGGGQETNPHLDLKSRQKRGSDPFPQSFRETNGTSDALRIQKRSASSFTALQECCSGADPTPAALGCVLQGE